MDDYLKLKTTLIGHCVAQIRLIFLVAPPKRAQPLRSWNMFLVYVERFDIVPQATSLRPGSSRSAIAPDPVTQMYLLKRAIRSDGRRFGDIVPLSQLRGPVQLTPHFGAKADRRLTMHNSLEYSGEFWLNKYANKEAFWAL